MPPALILLAQSRRSTTKFMFEVFEALRANRNFSVAVVGASCLVIAAVEILIHRKILLQQEEKAQAFEEPGTIERAEITEKVEPLEQAELFQPDIEYLGKGFGAEDPFLPPPYQVFRRRSYPLDNPTEYTARRLTSGDLARMRRDTVAVSNGWRRHVVDYSIVSSDAAAGLEVRNGDGLDDE